MLILPKTSLQGIQVDPAAATYPWRDLTADLVVRTTGTAAPAYSQIGATVFYAYDFVGATTLKEARVNFHLDHDYVAGTDIYFHVHWMPTDTGSGNVKWSADVCYAKGHNQAVFAFASPVSTSVTTAAPTVQYQHMISEMVISQAGAGSLINNTLFEPDGIIMVRFYRDPTDGADTYGSTAWVNFADCHYQSTGIGTKQKAPNFYT
jgi:hypothetical protein